MFSSYVHGAKCAGKISWRLALVLGGIVCIIAAMAGISWVIFNMPFVKPLTIAGLTWLFMVVGIWCCNGGLAACVAEIRNERRKARNRAKVAAQRRARLAQEGRPEATVWQHFATNWRNLVTEQREFWTEMFQNYRWSGLAILAYVAVCAGISYAVRGESTSPDNLLLLVIATIAGLTVGTYGFWNLIDGRYLPEKPERLLASLFTATFPHFGRVAFSLALPTEVSAPVLGSLIGLALIPGTLAFYYSCDYDNLPRRLRLLIDG